MLVTFTNNTISPVYVSAIYMLIAANSSVTTERSPAQLDENQSLKALVAAGTISLTFASETGDSFAAARVLNFNAPATASATAVTAAFGGDVAHNDPTDVGVTITSPAVPRNVTATFGATWGATNHIKVYGTDINNVAITETLLANPGTIRTGAKAFKTVTKVTKVLTDAPDAANICSIGTGVLLGVAGQIIGTMAEGHLIGTGFDPVTVDTTNNTVTTSTAPNGVRAWNITLNLSYP